MKLDVVSYSELAQSLKVCKRTLRRWWESGSFPEPIRLSPRKLVWRRQDIDAWLASRAELVQKDEVEA